MSSEIKKLNQALYYETVMQIEMNKLAESGEEITPEEYEKRCDELIHQKLFVENKAIDVIEFYRQLENRADNLKEKKKQISELQKQAESYQERAKKALTTWMENSELTSVEIEEYKLKFIKSSPVEINEEKPFDFPEIFINVNIDMTLIRAKELGLDGVKSVDKNLLKEWLKQGNKSECAKLVPKNNLQIKG